MARFDPKTGVRLDPEALANDWPEPEDGGSPDAQVLGGWDARVQPGAEDAIGPREPLPDMPPAFALTSEPSIQPEPTEAPTNTTATAATKPARTRRGKKKGR